MIISKPNEDGVVFVTGEEHKYLVTYEIEGELCEPVIETAREIFRKMKFDDCYDIKIRDLKWLKPYKTYDEYRFELNPYPTCEYKGTWCNTNPETGRIDPLRVEIRQKFGDGEVLDVGYQPEH